MLASLCENRKRFFKIRGSCQILVKSHAFRDYPERGFSMNEIINLVRNGNGKFVGNNSSEAITGSYVFLVKDDLERGCKLVILIKAVVIEDQKRSLLQERIITVCSAYRETKSKRP